MRPRDQSGSSSMGPFHLLPPPPASSCKSSTLFPCQPQHLSSYHLSPLRMFPPSPKLFPLSLARAQTLQPHLLLFFTLPPPQGL